MRTTAINDPVAWASVSLPRGQAVQKRQHGDRCRPVWDGDSCDPRHIVLVFSRWGSPSPTARGEGSMRHLPSYSGHIIIQYFHILYLLTLYFNTLLLGDFTCYVGKIQIVFIMWTNAATLVGLMTAETLSICSLHMWCNVWRPPTMLAGARFIAAIGTVTISITPARYVDTQTGQVTAKLVCRALYNTQWQTNVCDV